MEGNLYTTFYYLNNYLMCNEILSGELELESGV